MKLIVGYAITALIVFSAWGFRLYDQTQTLKASAYRLGVWYGQNCR